MRFFWRKIGKSANKWHTRAMMVDLHKTRITIEPHNKKPTKLQQTTASEKPKAEYSQRALPDPVKPRRKASRTAKKMDFSPKQAFECSTTKPSFPDARSHVLFSVHSNLRNVQ
jgi:hypothetical protein